MDIVARLEVYLVYSDSRLNQTYKYVRERHRFTGPDC